MKCEKVLVHQLFSYGTDIKGSMKIRGALYRLEKVSNCLDSQTTRGPMMNTLLEILILLHYQSGGVTCCWLLKPC